MRPEQITLVQSSFRAFAPVAWNASAEFYAELFRMAPDTRALFPSDLGEQRRKLIQTLTAVVNGLSYPQVMMPQVHALGRRHGGYRTRPDHYDMVGAALIATLRRSLGPDFTPEVEAAWMDCYALVAREMQAAA